MRSGQELVPRLVALLDELAVACLELAANPFRCLGGAAQQRDGRVVMAPGQPAVVLTQGVVNGLQARELAAVQAMVRGLRAQHQNREDLVEPRAPQLVLLEEFTAPLNGIEEGVRIDALAHDHGRHLKAVPIHQGPEPTRALLEGLGRGFHVGHDRRARPGHAAQHDGSVAQGLPTVEPALARLQGRRQLGEARQRISRKSQAARHQSAYTFRVSPIWFMIPRSSS